MKLGKINIGKNKNIRKANYKDIQEFKYDSKTNLVPKKRNRLICIIFSEDKGCYIILRKFNIKTDNFIFKNGMYIIDNEAIHITGNGSRVAFYMEGISTPLKMSNIEKTIEEVDYIDLYGVKRKTIIQKIKGLKFDSNILNTFANRKFAELFTKQPLDKMAIFILCVFIFGIVTMIISVIGCVITYVYR
jgi:hypothetical protein